jgi:hypothetical protein
MRLAYQLRQRVSFERSRKYLGKATSLCWHAQAERPCKASPLADVGDGVPGVPLLHPGWLEEGSRQVHSIAHTHMHINMD